MQAYQFLRKSILTQAILVINIKISSKNIGCYLWHDEFIKVCLRWYKFIIAAYPVFCFFTIFS